MPGRDGVRRGDFDASVFVAPGALRRCSPHSCLFRQRFDALAVFGLSMLRRPLACVGHFDARTVLGAPTVSVRTTFSGLHHSPGALP
jgi:hypothetical protein